MVSNTLSLISYDDIPQEERPLSYNFNDVELFPPIKKHISDQGPTQEQCYASCLELAVANKYTLCPVTQSVRNLCSNNSLAAPTTRNDYEILISDLSDLAMNACVAAQYVAHLACKEDAERKTVNFIDYMKATIRHLDKARQTLDQIV